MGNAEYTMDQDVRPKTKVLLEGWLSAPEYQSEGGSLSVAKFHEITDLLLERPNLNSTHLFRADILSDTAAKLNVITEISTLHVPEHCTVDGSCPDEATMKAEKQEQEQEHKWHPTDVSGYDLKRKVVRRLIPRKPQLDCPLEQSCFIYDAIGKSCNGAAILVVYVPHVTSAEQVPWYHPQVKSLAYHYQQDAEGTTISIHYQPFSGLPNLTINRLHRTFLALLHTFNRLSRLDPQQDTQFDVGNNLASTRSLAPAVIKDTILPQHIVQNTYARLKQTYATDLFSRWVEKTEPSKHVFEDLSIAAFLIELWKTMYNDQAFPGFVDIACGNGILVYILVKEGFRGLGFDARRRKTWEVLGIDKHLEEKICIPKPFLEELEGEVVEGTLPGIQTQNGIFDPGTFIISNHADELTLWTPLLAAMSCHEQPLPFLAIPCCSHALSGARHRYSFKDIDTGLDIDHKAGNPSEDDQPASGDLRVLRREKKNATSHADDKSTYACLTKKTIALSEELGFETDVTLLRIPSTRNIGVVGNRHLSLERDVHQRNNRIHGLIDRECSISGGVSASAKIWIERAKKLVEGKGRGKVNLGRSVV